MYTFPCHYSVQQQVANVDYEIFMGPLALYEWEEHSQLDVDYAHFLVRWHQAKFDG